MIVAAAAEEVRDGQLVAGPPVLLSTPGSAPGRCSLQVVGDDLTLGPARAEVRTKAHYLLAAGGRVFSLGPTPDMGRSPEKMEQPGAWWPLTGPFTHPDNGRYELLTELDPRTGESIDATLVGRPDHLTVDGSGTFWLPGHSAIYSCPRGHGTALIPFDVADLLVENRAAAPRGQESLEEN